MTTLLNADLVRARRLELGLSERQLSAVTGLGQAVIRGLEAGTNHKDLTLADLTRLADTLAVDLHQLLTPNPTTPIPAGPATMAAHTEHHIAQVGALLFDIDRLIPVEALAVSIGLTLDQTHTVLDDLDQQLRPVGLTLHRPGNSVKLGRTIDSVTTGTLEQAWKEHLARRGLNISQAATIQQVRDGRRRKTLTNDQQVTVAQLTNAGILTRTPSGGAQLSDNVRYSLLLDEGHPDEGHRDESAPDGSPLEAGVNAAGNTRPG